MQSVALVLADCILQKVKSLPVHQKNYSKTALHTRKKIYYILSPMKISESIEAHMSAAVAAISQRNQATLPGFHKIIISPVINIFRIFKAKAFSFCLFLYGLDCHTGSPHFVMPDLIGHLPFIQAKEIPAYAGMTIKKAGLIHKFNIAYTSEL